MPACSFACVRGADKDAPLLLGCVLLAVVPMCEAGIRKLAPYLTNLAHLTELNVAGTVT